MNKLKLNVLSDPFLFISALVTQNSSFRNSCDVSQRLYSQGCPKKNKSTNFGSQLTPLVFIGLMSHQKKFQHYRPINNILATISSFTL